MGHQGVALEFRDFVLGLWVAQLEARLMSQLRGTNNILSVKIYFLALLSWDNVISATYFVQVQQPRPPHWRSRGRLFVCPRCQEVTSKRSPKYAGNSHWHCYKFLKSFQCFSSFVGWIYVKFCWKIDHWAGFLATFCRIPTVLITFPW